MGDRLKALKSLGVLIIFAISCAVGVILSWVAVGILFGFYGFFIYSVLLIVVLLYLIYRDILKEVKDENLSKR